MGAGCGRRWVHVLHACALPSTPGEPTLHAPLLPACLPCRRLRSRVCRYVVSTSDLVCTSPWVHSSSNTLPSPLGLHPWPSGTAVPCPAANNLLHSRFLTPPPLHPPNLPTLAARMVLTTASRCPATTWGRWPTTPATPPHAPAAHLPTAPRRKGTLPQRSRRCIR